jgi:hypothetical protein
MLQFDRDTATPAVAAVDRPVAMANGPTTSSSWHCRWPIDLELDPELSTEHHVA